MPRLAPVTMATLPVRLKSFMSLLGNERDGPKFKSVPLILPLNCRARVSDNAVLDFACLEQSGLCLK